jgi:hypothetical protein
LTHLPARAPVRALPLPLLHLAQPLAAARLFVERLPLPPSRRRRGLRGINARGGLHLRLPPLQPARPFPSAIFRDKNRRDIGKSQSIWTDSKMETAG